MNVNIMGILPVVRVIGAGVIVAALIVGGCLSPEETMTGNSQDNLIEAGIATVDITPREPIRLGGYGGRTTESDGVAQNIWAKAVALGSDEEGPVVLITTDLIGISSEITDGVAATLAREAGIGRADLAVGVTHTHSGPMVDGVLPFMFGGSRPPEHQQRIEAYTERLVGLLEQVALDALENRLPSQVAWGKGEVSFATNRRVLEDGEWTGFGHTDGPVDHDLPLLSVRDPSGDLRAVLISYACHNTTLGGSFNRVHGDWAGVAQAEIEAEHPGAVALVGTGAGGDQNPNPRGDVSQAEEHGRAIAAEVSRLLDSESLKRLTAVPTTRYETIELPFADIPTESEWEEQAGEDGVVGARASVMLEKIKSGEGVPQTLEYVMQTWTFGDELSMVFLAGEVVVDYSLRLKEELDGDRLWVMAYTNDVPCYIASARVIREGGYEVDRSMRYYGQPSRLSTDVEDMIISTVHEMVPRRFVSSR
jgi:hypothetical protein